MEAKLGVTGPQRLVLRIVGRFPGIPAGQLATLLHIDPSTLTGILKRLETRGFLRRRADPRDARRSLLSLTQEGRFFDVEAEGTIEASVAKALARAPAHKVEAAREVLTELAQRLHLVEPKPHPELLPAARKRRRSRAGEPRRGRS